MTLRTRPSVPRGNDQGVGVITVIMVMAVLGSFLITATGITINNLGNTSRDRQALSALATSEAGVAQAIQYLRSGSLGSLTCVEPAAGAAPGATCEGPGPSWTSATNPMEVKLDGPGTTCVVATNCFKVWIGTVAPYVPNCAGRSAVPPLPCSATYRVHSTGLAGGGPSARRLAVDVSVTPYPFPIGVFAETLSGGGNVGVHKQSIFTNGCMANRTEDGLGGGGIEFEYDTAAGRPVLDLIYNQPAAAHSTGQISTGNACSWNGNNGPIHEIDKNNSGQKRCNPAFRFDQDSQGGALTSGDGCYGAYTRPDGTVYPTTSAFTQADLQKYDYRPRGLTDAQYDALKTQAQAQGTYNLSTANISATLTGLAAAGVASPVLYWDNASVSLNKTDFPAEFLRSTNTSGTCVSKSVTIVVSGPGRDLTYQGGNTTPYLSASIFVPDGTLRGIGGMNTIGTVFAKTLDLGGNVDFYMDQCFASNPPGGTLDVQVTDWREDDSRNIN